MTETLTLHDLRQFTGTEHWFRHWMERQVTYTDGMQHVAETAGAYWLIDAIAFAQSCVEPVKAEQFQVWKLTVTDHRAVLACEDGNGNHVYKQAIEYTDFPLPQFTVWVSNNVMMLPSEY